MTPDLCDFAWRVGVCLLLALICLAAGLIISIRFEKVPDVTEELHLREHFEEALERSERRG